MSSYTWGPEEKAAVMEVMESGFISMGKKVREFEESYARFVGSKYCVLLNSGSSANLLMVAARTLRHGAGTVIVPAVGWSTSYAPFQQYGWTLVFVDVDPYSLGYNQAQLYQAIEQFTPDCILAINLLGNSEDYDELPKYIPILEDNCESMGTVYRGKTTGSFGEMASHSTYFSHTISTGEGGMVTTNDEYYQDMLLSLRSHGWTRELSPDNKLHAKVDKFNFIYPGYCMKPTEIQAVLGIEQLKKLPEFIETRRYNAKTIPIGTQTEIGTGTWFGFVIYGKDRAKCHDVETRPIVTGNFLRQPAIQYFKHYKAGKMTGADFLTDEAMMIGNSHMPIDWSNYIAIP